MLLGSFQKWEIYQNFQKSTGMSPENLLKFCLDLFDAHFYETVVKLCT